MKCDIPQLRHRVLLQSRTRASDGQGGYTEDWATEATLWASIEPANGYERMTAQKLGTSVSHKVLIRYRPGVTTAKRLVFKGRIFEIKESLNDKEANRWLKLKCVETAGTFTPPDWAHQGTPWENWATPWGPVTPDAAWEAQGTPWEAIGQPWGPIPPGAFENLASGWDAVNTNWEALG